MIKNFKTTIFYIKIIDWNSFQIPINLNGGKYQLVRRSQSDLPLAPVERIIKETTKMLVSESAAEELREILAEFAEMVALDAAELAVFAKRKTIKDRDIALAYKNIRKTR
jgi:histone H3/H4